ncbi:MAG: T9SS type A sorting domain-containing protein [candidate division Zixibacteria bacterium]|nr:T9SS type A sorting domain-containing protein [candidate division Zixibacteria bacterium]
MKKLVIFALIMALAASGAYAKNSTFNWPILPQPADSSGTPDSYGYTWVDNDNGGSPVYNWVDITGTGVLVDGLADDNAVGPFDIGFVFPFYWYSVDEFFIGSNGYISFSSDANYSQDFPMIPNTSQPNDLVVPLACDIDFTAPYGTNECYMYTNNTDSLVVSWIGVCEWNNPYNPTATHTFQLILSAADSSITFQYGEQGGDFQNPDGASQIGIEDLVGRTGLRYLYNLDPPDRAPHDGLAIRIHAEPDPSFEFKDVGPNGAMNAGSQGIFQAVDSPLSFGGYIQNFGTIDVENVRAILRMKREYSVVLNDTVYIDNLNAGEVLWVDFDDTYTPDQEAVYSIEIKTSLTGDQFFFNNADTTEMRSYILPATLAYADTVFTYTSWEGGGGGFANEFVAPEAIEITAVRANMQNTGAFLATVILMGANEAGNPDEDNIYFEEDIAVTDPGWYVATLPVPAIIYGGEKFFAAALSGGDGIGFGVDSSWPLSHRGWENTAGYAPSRDRDLQDIGITVLCDLHVGIDDDNSRPINFSLNQNYPNPFNANTEINFSLDKTSTVDLSVYNMLGQKVATLVSGDLPADNHTVSWDASDVATGVYFYRLEVENNSETRKMILLK